MKEIHVIKAYSKCSPTQNSKIASPERNRSTIISKTEIRTAAVALYPQAKPQAVKQHCPGTSTADEQRQYRATVPSDKWASSTFNGMEQDEGIVDEDMWSNFNQSKFMPPVIAALISAV
jgi:hypothetical protein